MDPNDPGLRDRLWDAIAIVRDAAPRLSTDADTDEIVDAVLDVLTAAVPRPDDTDHDEPAAWRVDDAAVVEVAEFTLYDGDTCTCGILKPGEAVRLVEGPDESGNWFVHGAHTGRTGRVAAANLRRPTDRKAL